MKQHRYKCLFTCLLTHSLTYLLTHLLKGLAQESRLPPTTKYSEGNSYNILNHEILDETKFKIAMKSMFQAANRQTSSAILAKQKQEGTHSLTYSLTHLLTHSPTHSLTYSLTHLTTHSLTNLRRIACGY